MSGAAQQWVALARLCGRGADLEARVVECPAYDVFGAEPQSSGTSIEPSSTVSTTTGGISS